jgi:ribosomal protein L37AE/L43A
VDAFANMLWRILFIIYAVALTVSTHWPRLKLGAGGDASPDKVLHFASFGALTFILWQARWIRSKWLLVAVALAWATLDELSQSIAFVERIASWHDWIASAAGVLTVGAWLWALSPVGARLNRLRLKRSQLASDRVLARVSSLAWIAIGGGGGIAGGAMVVLLVSVIGEEPQADARLLTVLATAGAGAMWVYIMLLRREIDSINARRACLSCAQSIEQPSCDAEGRGTCAACGETFLLGQWLPAVLPARAAPLRLLLPPALVALLLLVLGALVFLVILLLAMEVSNFRRALRGVNEGGPELILVLDMAYIFIAVAVGARFFRHKLARVYDRQGAACVNCRYDLHATPAELGIGTCNECGVKFMRISEGK